MDASVESRFRAFTEKLKVPAIAAPMFLVTGPQLVIAAAKAGMAAAFPAPNARTLEELESWILQIKQSLGPADAPWAMNVVAHQSYGRMQDELELIARYQPPMVITALGSPRRVVDAVHSYGGLVFADVIATGFARKCLQAGVDGLILVCAGAGGHTGQLSPFAFVSAVREFFGGPLVVGGAVNNGRAIRAVEVLGAELAYVGTPFVAAVESLAPDAYKDMLVASTHEDLVQTNAVTGVRANWLRASLEKVGIDPLKVSEEGPVFSDPTAAFRRWKDTWSAGQGVDLVRRVEPAADIVGRLVGEYRAVLA
ncbi:MAG: nitronate monooxygenase [Micropepsaceae bacterium]